jgi:hypothetical protein
MVDGWWWVGGAVCVGAGDDAAVVHEAGEAELVCEAVEIFGGSGEVRRGGSVRSGDGGCLLALGGGLEGERLQLG